MSTVNCLNLDLGKVEGENHWKSLIRQAVLNNFLSKDIDNYGLIDVNQSRATIL